MPHARTAFAPALAKRALLAALTLAVGACAAPNAPPQTPAPAQSSAPSGAPSAEPDVRHFTVDAPAIRAAVASPDRLAEDFARDAGSRPAEVLEFLGLAPGMRVLDMNAATGYYTELLARVVGPAGHVIAHNHPGALTALKPADFERRYGGARLPNVEQLFVPHNGIALPTGSLDAVPMSMVYHDTYWYDPKVDWGPVDRQALLRSLHDALAPSGVIGVIDHYAAAGTDPNTSAMATHRIDPDVVQRDFRAAGFELEAQSDLLRHPVDDLTKSVFDDAVHGRTDRFVMRFRHR
jgi:predicted methyltransferase